MFERYVINIIYIPNIIDDIIYYNEALIKINEWTGIRTNNVEFRIKILNGEIKNFGIEYKKQFERYVKKYKLVEALKYKKQFIYKFGKDDINQSLENFTEKHIKE